MRTIIYSVSIIWLQQSEAEINVFFFDYQIPVINLITVIIMWQYVLHVILRIFWMFRTNFNITKMTKFKKCMTRIVFG